MHLSLKIILNYVNIIIFIFNIFYTLMKFYIDQILKFIIDFCKTLKFQNKKYIFSIEIIIFNFLGILSFVDNF